MVSRQRASAPRGSKTLQVSDKAFLLICTSHVTSGSKLDSTLMKHNRSGSFGSSLTVIVAFSILLDLSRWARNCISLHHLFSEIIPNLAVFELLLAWCRFGFFGRSTTPLDSQQCPACFVASNISFHRDRCLVSKKLLAQGAKCSCTNF